MAVVLRDRETDLPPPRGIAAPFIVAKRIVTDPGIIYTASDALLFATTNVVGFIACLGAVGVAAALKAADVMKPGFLEKHPRIKAVAYDDRTPLRAGAMALLVVGGAALMAGAWLPAAASFFLGAANIAMANSISRQDHSKPGADPARKDKPGIGALLFKRPDLYLNIGFALAGLMAGGASLYILPLVAVAFGVGMNNVIKGRPEHEGHPKMITSMAAFAFAGIGFATGHGLIAVAHLINAAVIAEFERRVTPGGNMLEVLRESTLTLGRIVGIVPKKASKPEAAPQPQLQTAPDLADANARVRVMGVKGLFRRTAQKPAEAKPAPQPAPAPDIIGAHAGEAANANDYRPSPGFQDRLRRISMPG